MMLRVLLYETPDDPHMNLAFEEALPRAVGCGLSPATLRLWRNRRAVVIGYFQRAEEEVNLEEAERLGVAVVRRFTGGGAAYHDLGNINYAISLPAKGQVGETVNFIFSELIRAPVEALRSLGLEASVQNVNDIVVENRKVSGTAATISWRATFFHGAMLVSADLSALASVLKVPLKKLIDKGVSSVKYRVTNISSIRPGITVNQVAEALASSFARVLGYDGVKYDVPTSEELEIAETLYYHKYRERAWNLERTPHRDFREAEEEVKRICRA